MELQEKAETPRKDPAMTAREESAALLHHIDKQLTFVFIKLTTLNTGLLIQNADNLKEDQLFSGTSRAEKTQAEITRALQGCTGIEELLRTEQAKYELEEAQFEIGTQRQSTYPVIMQALT